MARVKRSVHAKKKRREILEKAKGYTGSRNTRYRVAKEQVMHSGNYAYRDRRDRKAQFRRLWIATSLSSLGDWLSLVALSTLASTLAPKGSAAQGAAVGGVWLTSLLPALLLGPLAGAVADRLDRRLNMIVGDVLRAALYLSLVLDLSLGFAPPTAIGLALETLLPRLPAPRLG